MNNEHEVNLNVNSKVILIMFNVISSVSTLLKDKYQAHVNFHTKTI